MVKVNIYNEFQKIKSYMLCANCVHGKKKKDLHFVVSL